MKILKKGEEKAFAYLKITFIILIRILFFQIMILEGWFAIKPNQPSNQTMLLEVFCIFMVLRI